MTELERILTNAGAGVNDIERFRIFSEYMIERNAIANLTAIVDPKEIYIKHFEDSLTILPFLAGRATLADVGSGAGFPGVPAAIVLPGLEVTLIESTAKKTDFLADLAEKLGLANVRIFKGRAEDAGRDLKLREKFDVATARAVASVPVLAEYCLPLLKVGGIFLAMKGPNMDDVDISTAALAKIGGKIVEIRTLKLSDGSGRNLVVVEKTRPTPPEYPRRNGVPSKTPILK
jgi:16S rRNA (guanine527-N7)-methyltransferase